MQDTAIHREAREYSKPGVIDAQEIGIEDQAVHFIGIGGCGVSGLARLMRQVGAVCTGSDHTPSELTWALEADGIAVCYQQTAEAIPRRCDLVIASAAIKPEHRELLAAQQRAIPTMTYAEALGMVQTRRTGVSIAGTHGKSTSAAMLCHVLIECGLDPSFIVGANCAQIGGGSRVGSPVVPGEGSYAGRRGLLIAEACEFNRSFHHHRPVVGLINNVEQDHLDVYGDLSAIIEAFGEFAELLPPADRRGHLLIAHDGAHRREITGGLCCKIETFGFNPAADYSVMFDPEASHVTITHDQQPVAEWTNSMPGEHNALNSAAAAVLGHILGADWDRIGDALDTFVGIDRRMQRLGSKTLASGSVVVYDDYGHHPTEIEATLRALKTMEQPKRLVCVFQPHQHSRTRFLLEEFAQSFTSADVVIVPHIYFVRDSEVEKQRVSAADLVDRLRQRDIAAMHVYPFEAIVEQLEMICRDGDLVVVMGAGPVWQVAHQFLGSSKSR